MAKLVQFVLFFSLAILLFAHFIFYVNGNILDVEDGGDIEIVTAEMEAALGDVGERVTKNMAVPDADPNAPKAVQLLSRTMKDCPDQVQCYNFDDALKESEYVVLLFFSFEKHIEVTQKVVDALWGAALGPFLFTTVRFGMVDIKRDNDLRIKYTIGRNEVPTHMFIRNGEPVMIKTSWQMPLLQHTKEGLEKVLTDWVGGRAFQYEMMKVDSKKEAQSLLMLAKLVMVMAADVPSVPFYEFRDRMENLNKLGYFKKPDEDAEDKRARVVFATARPREIGNVASGTFVLFRDDGVAMVPYKIRDGFVEEMLDKEADGQFTFTPVPDENTPTPGSPAGQDSADL